MFELKRIVATSVIAVLMALSVGLAQAATIDITVYDDPVGLTGERGTLSCSAACSVLNAEPGVFSPGVGGVFTVHPPNLTNETSFVNANLFPGDAAFATGFKTEPAPNPFTTSALYILMKIGGGNTFNTVLVRNETNGGSLELTWDGNSASGLSHVTEFGGAVPIPHPAGGLLLITALGGLGIAVRRRRKVA